MNISTKFNKWEYVHFMSNNTVCKAQIQEIRTIDRGEGPVYIEYVVGTLNTIVSEDKLFRTKEELINSL